MRSLQEPVEAAEHLSNLIGQNICFGKFLRFTKSQALGNYKLCL